jgi:Tfp pilus assembly protein PilF
LYVQSIEVRISLFGLESLAVAATYNNYGGLLFSLREMETAQDMFEDALRIRRKILGEEHPDVAASLNNVGLLLYSQGHLKEALPVYQQALAIKIKCMGENNASVATSLNNLAGLQHKLGDLVEAHNNYQKAYILRATLLGSSHKDTLACKENIKQVETDQQRVREKNASKRAQVASGGGYRAAQQQAGVNYNDTALDDSDMKPILSTAADFDIYEQSHYSKVSAADGRTDLP